MTVQKRKEQLKKRKDILFYIVVTSMIVSSILFWIMMICKVDARTAQAGIHEIVTTMPEQKYIVRYGTTNMYGNKIVTEDAKIWTLTDAPEFSDGTEVRILFDSNETSDPTDDIIIDITERNCN